MPVFSGNFDDNIVIIIIIITNGLLNKGNWYRQPKVKHTHQDIIT